MGWYTCRNCKHEFHSGLFNITYCPKCWSKFSQIFGVLKFLGKILIIPVLVLLIMRCAAPDLQKTILSSTAAAIDSTTLYAYSKDAYLESIIRGRQEHSFYTITRNTPYYSSILSGTRLEETEPMGVLPNGVVVELRSIIRRGENVWVPAFFYVQDKPQQAFALFPRNWDDNVRVFNRDERVSSIRAQYENTVKNNFELRQVLPDQEKEFRERYNDYYKIRDIGGDDMFFYAPRADRSRINNIHSYFLNANNLNMVILQADREWKRPDLVINKQEGE